MANIDREIFLSQANDLTKKHYTDMVNAQGKKKYTAEEENARLRKAVKLLANFVALNHPEIVYMPEYKELIEYYNDYEQIKAEAKARLNIN